MLTLWKCFVFFSLSKECVLCLCCVFKVGKTFELLNCDQHKNIIIKSGRDPGNVRPDITHQVTAESLDDTSFNSTLYCRATDLVLVVYRHCLCWWTAHWTEQDCCRCTSTPTRTRWSRSILRHGFHAPSLASVDSWVTYYVKHQTWVSRWNVLPGFTLLL